MIAGESERVEEDEVGVEEKGDDHLGDDNKVVGRDANRKKEMGVPNGKEEVIMPNNMHE